MRALIRCVISLLIGWGLLFPIAFLGELSGSPFLSGWGLVHSGLVLLVWPVLVWAAYRVLDFLPFFRSKIRE